MSTVTKALIGLEDLKRVDGGSTTFNRINSSGGVDTLTKIHLRKTEADDYAEIRTNLTASEYIAGDLIVVLDADQAGLFEVKSGSVTDNKITLITDGGDLYAQRILADYMTVDMYEDVVGDGATDDAAAINSCITTLAALDISEIFTTKTTYYLTNTITIPGGVGLGPRKFGGTTFKYYADVVAIILSGAIAEITNRLRLELDSTVSGTKNCIEVGTLASKANACRLSANIIAYGNIASTAASVGDGVYIKNANFVYLGSLNIEMIGRDGVHVSNDTGDTNAGFIGHAYVNVCGRHAYYFGQDVSGWRGFPNALNFQGSGIYFDNNSKFNRLVGDIEAVGSKGAAWTFDPDVFSGYENGVYYASGCFGNDAKVYPIADHTFQTPTEQERNLCQRRAAANEWEAMYGLMQFSDGFWINDESVSGELQITQTAAGEYTIHAGGTGGTSTIKITQSGSGLSLTLDGTLELIPDGRIANPNANADDLHIHAATGGANAGISIVTANTATGSVRFADTGNDSAGNIAYDHNSDHMTFNANDANSARLDNNTTAGNTRFLVYDVDNASLERVSVGAADSGGSGYKVLRIPN